MFERFTDRARRVVILAQEEAKLLRHNYIGTEHLLLGLIAEGEGGPARVLDSLGISIDAVRDQVATIKGCGEALPTGHVPFTPRAKKVLELSLSETLALGSDHIGAEHLLLGLLAEGEGAATRVLAELRVDGDVLRQRVLQGLMSAAIPGMDMFIMSATLDEVTDGYAISIELPKGTTLEVTFSIEWDGVRSVFEPLRLAQPLRMAATEESQPGQTED